MSNITTKIWTKNLTSGSLEITKEMGLTLVSIMLLSGGSGTISGSATVGGQNSDAAALVENVPITFSSSGNYPLEGITITNSSGTIQIFARV